MRSASPRRACSFAASPLGDATTCRWSRAGAPTGPCQHVVATLGRAEDWLEAGKLDQLLQSGARLSETALVLSAVRNGEGLAVDSRRIGAPLIFERLWRGRRG